MTKPWALVYFKAFPGASNMQPGLRLLQGQGHWILTLGWPTNSGSSRIAPASGVPRVSFAGGDFGKVEAPLFSAPPDSCQSIQGFPKR